MPRLMSLPQRILTVRSETIRPTYSVTAAQNSINEGSPLTFTVSVEGIANGTTLFYTVSRSEDFTVASGSFSINNLTGSFTVTPAADQTAEGSETFTASVRTDSTSGTVVATSGTVTINDTSNTPDLTAEVELIGGGGGGGGGGSLWEDYAGAGGAGGRIYATITISRNTTYNVGIGTGGIGGPVNQANDVNNNAFGTNGGNTSGFGFTAIGGGAGTHRNGISGGSGGGAGGSFFDTTGGEGTTGQGFKGGDGVRAGSPNGGGGGGGGGGAGGPGSNYSRRLGRTDGGAGVVSPIDGVTRAVGGEASSFSIFDGAANTGNGGSGGAHTRESGFESFRGGNGGSGVILVKFSSALPNPTTSGITASVTTAGAFKILTITSGGGTVRWN